MKKFLLVSLLITLTLAAHSKAAESGKYLFIMSGQSNMNELDETLTFQPAIESALGKDNVIIVKDAENGQSIRRWYKGWKPKSSSENDIGELYDRLMTKVKSRIEGEKITSVTFLWMQGENDAKRKMEMCMRPVYSGSWTN